RQTREPDVVATAGEPFQARPLGAIAEDRELGASGWDGPRPGLDQVVDALLCRPPRDADDAVSRPFSEAGVAARVASDHESGGRPACADVHVLQEVRRGDEAVD